MLKKEVSSKLKKYNQEHLLNFYDELNFLEKIKLNRDIKKIDFELMNNLYKNSFFNDEIDMNLISNLKCIHNININEEKEYIDIGKKIVNKGKYAVVIMAGGNASRLGLNGPKGCLELNINDKKVSLFEIFINQLKTYYKKENIYLNLYIMTSNYNYKETISFFKKNNYFNYPKKKIKFFIQNELPILDIDGKILLKEKNKVLFGPNGNGDVFNSLKKNKIINHMKKNKIEYALFSTVDNALTNLIDLKFIGATIHNGYKLSTKTLFKKDENAKDWVFCKYNGKPFMLPSSYINLDISNKKDENDDYLYRETNITYHLLSFDNIEKLSNTNLKYHRAYKKNNYINEEGTKINADKPNTFKFEKFIFDGFYYCDDMLLYRTDENEFCPIKNYDDIKKVEEEFFKKQ